MANIGQMYYNVLNNRTGAYNSNIELFNSDDSDRDLIPLYVRVSGSNYSVYKLGIQAPPGTQLKINNKTILIGRTGIYELDANIAVTSLIFLRPTNYIKDETATITALAESGATIAELEQERDRQLQALLADYGGVVPVLATNPTEAQIANYTGYWDRYVRIQQTYSLAYQTALGTYNQGVAGIYIVSQTPGDLYNVVIDYTYE